MIRSTCQWLLIAGLFFAAGCSTTQKDPTADWSAKDFYTEARAALNTGEFQTAIKHLETLEARFPFDPYAKQAQLDVAYSYYKFDEPETAIGAVQRFIRLHPRDPHIDYALYLKGLINFNRGKGLLDKWFPHDPAKHDTQVLQQAFNDFAQLVKRFPDSKYAGDAYQRMIYLRNKLAENEIDNAEYYVKRKTWLAAANRAKVVLEKYPNSIWRNRALQILALSYEQMGLNDLARDARRVLEMNHITGRQQHNDSLPDNDMEQPPSLI